MLDETDAVASTSNITWNIGSNDLVAVNKPTENSYTLQGKEYGNDELDCNVVYTISGTTDSFTKNLKIPFACNHAYAIPTINDITILTGNQTSMAKLELHDENNKAVTDQIEWSITTPVGQHSTFSWIDQAAGTYQITGNTSTFKTGESADIYTVTAKYKGEEFNQTIKVNVHDYKFATIDNVSIKYNDTTSTKTLKLLGDKDE